MDKDLSSAVDYSARLAHLGLHAAGRDPGPPGPDGFRTDELRQFQRDNRLPDDGQLDDATLAALEQALVDAFHRWLAVDATGRDVETLQRALALFELDPGPLDGIFGRGTAAVVRRYQELRGLDPDGIVGPLTWGSLTGLPPARFHRILGGREEGLDVWWVQAVLGALGHDPGPIDGKYGVRSREAVGRFQASVGLDADGAVGPATWPALERRGARELAGATFSPELAVTFAGGRPVALVIRQDGLPVQVDLDDLVTSGPLLPVTSSRAVALTVAEGPRGPVSVTVWNDGTVRVHDVDSGRERGAFALAPTESTQISAALIDDSPVVAVEISGDGQHRWEVSQGTTTPLAAMEGIDVRITVVEDRAMLVWIDPGTRRVVRRYLHGDEFLEDMRGSADDTFDRLLVGGPPDRPVLVTRSSTGLIERWAADTAERLPGGIRANGDGTELIAVGRDIVVTGPVRGPFRRFRLADGHETGEPIHIPRASVAPIGRASVTTLAVAEDNGRRAVAALDQGGFLWAWTEDPERDATSVPPLLVGRTRLVHDQRSREDQLGRENLAGELAELIQQLATDPDSPGAFALHLDGAWGAGKSTVVGFLAERFREAAPPRPKWVVVELDAWRSSQLSPAWWAVLGHLRKGVRGSLGFWEQRQFDVLRFGREAARVWKVWVPPVVVLAALLVVWLVNDDVDALMAVITAVLAFIGVVGGLGSRFLSLGSLQGARLHERLNDNPMAEVAAQIVWLRKQCKRPILLVLDDLDRCNEKFAVELLDAVQTLLRAPPSTRKNEEELPALVVLAVGDHRWLRAAYENAYSVFSPYVSEPGRPLGHLFLDKLFQVRIELPHLSTAQLESYVSFLLGTEDGDADAPEVGAIEAQIRAVGARAAPEGTSLDNSMTSLVSEARSLTTEQRQGLAAVALEVRRQDTRRGEREHHLLEQYAELLEPNPRAAKRFLMTYNIAYATRLSELAPFDSETLALWTVLAVRWPALADWLREQLPDGPFDPIGGADHPSQLLLDRDVQKVLSSSKGGPIDITRLRRCCGHLVPDASAG